MSEWSDRTSFRVSRHGSRVSESTPLLPSRPRSSQTLQGLFRKSKVYDQTAIQGNGMRAWYSDYTTIDWIHDHGNSFSKRKTSQLT